VIAAASGPLISGALVAWFVLLGLSVAYVAWDASTRNPELAVMRWGWALVTLYTGPVGASLYVLSCKEPTPGAHEEFVSPRWKQTLGSSIHCLAGDVTGIIVAATVLTSIGVPAWAEVMGEYAIGFGFGLMIFQALFMRNMLGGSYVGALGATVVPEWLSMNLVMAAMIPVLAALRHASAGAVDPASLRYWGAISVATLAALVAAYPVNWWLVSRNLKHGMGTVRALGEGGHQVAAEERDMAKKPRPTCPEVVAVAALSVVSLAVGSFVAVLVR